MVKQFIDVRMHRLKRKFHRALIWARLVSFPFFEGVPLYDVVKFFYYGVVNGSLTTRASAIAFNFLLAMFPGIIFIFTLLPYIPIDNFQTELFEILQDLIPSNAFEAVKGTIEDILTQSQGGLLSVGFFMALLFSTSGIDSMITAFNATTHTVESRSWLNQRLVSLALVIILFVLITLGVSLIIISEVVIDILVDKGLFQRNFTFYTLLAGKWLVVLLIFFMAFSFLYYFAPAKRDEWRFISVGGTLGTILTILISLGFTFYINNFGRYNTLYGSIGTLIVIMLWFYFNAFSLLIGFELNASIQSAGNRRHKLKRVLKAQSHRKH